MVVNGGTLGEHKGINAPGVALPRRRGDAEGRGRTWGSASTLGVDMVALSFVQTPEDCHAARRIAAGERHAADRQDRAPQALEHLDAILAAADGVMVARGDLGLECPLEQVPRIQKTIIGARARARASR